MHILFETSSCEMLWGPYLYLKTYLKLAELKVTMFGVGRP